EPAAVLRSAVRELPSDRVDIETATAPATWRFDAARMQQALANLVRNALEASPDGERVSATAEADGKALVSRIRDRGAELPQGRPAPLYEPVHTTRVHGTGLGLAVARRIAELHGGRVTARTHPGGGAEFCIVIP